jgi:hypothetical protein
MDDLERELLREDIGFALDALAQFGEADSDRLAVALDALIENAVNFTSPDDSIELAVREDAGMAAAHGGSVRVASHEGEGSVVGILPMTDGTYPLLSGGRAAQRAPANTREIHRRG